MSFAPTSGRSPRSFTVELVEHWQDLESQAAAWDALADAALEPNPFFAPSATLAALRHLPQEGTPAFLIVRGVDPRAPADPLWCGFFPFVRHSRYRGLPLRNLRLLKHDYCFLRMPLVRADCAGEVLDAALAWVESSDCALVELGDQPGDGSYADALAAALARRGARPWLATWYARAALQVGSAPEAYIRAALSKSKLKELRRLERRLGERGELKVDALSATGDVDAGIEEFLALEAAGWKGAKGTAMACRPGDRAFFTQLARDAWQRDRLQLLSLRLDGRPIAMKCNLLVPPGSFAFKIAYAEEFAQQSPGVLLELENIRQLHGEGRVRWMDSCAAPGHPMIDRLWTEQRVIHSWLLPLSATGRLAVLVLSRLHRLGRALRAGKSA